MNDRWYDSSVDDVLPALDEIDCQRTLAIVQARMFGEHASMPQLDRFVVLRGAGEGAMGRVYVARDPSLDREVAIKVIRIAGDQAVDDSRRKRLEREARAAARISHPNVVTIHEVGVNDESLFVVMEYIDGQTLHEWLDAADRPWTDIVQAFIHAGRGLAAAHAENLVHRDFKPDNVLVGKDGRICVVDFGLVLVASESPLRTAERSEAGPHAPSSSTGSVTEGTVGTPAYMSPEQREGGPVDARSDQYSFCVALYEALYGVRPQLGEPIGTPRDNLKSVPAWVLEAIVRGMQPRPEERYETMPMLLSDLLVDPSRGRLQKGWLLAGGALLVGGGLWAASTSAGDVDPCPDAAALVTSTWNEDVRQDIESALQRTGAGYTDATFERIATDLDGYATAWAEHRDAACRETRVTHEQPDAIMVARLRCLDDRKRQLAAAVSVLSDADATVAENAVRVVERLPSVSLCSDVQYLSADVKPPETEDDRSALAQLQERLSTVRARAAAGKYEAAAKLADALIPEAEQLDYPPILPPILLERGLLHGLLGEHELQRTTLQRSFYAATTAGDDRTALEAALALVYLPGRVDEGGEDLQWTETASALIDRNERDGQQLTPQRAELTVARGRVLAERGEPEQALERYAEGLELYRGEAAYVLRVATIRNYMGSAQLSLGRIDESVASFERALQAAQEAYGPDHPRVATILTNLALSRRNAGAFDEAVVVLERAYAISTQAYGRVHPKIARILTVQATIELDRGQAEAALTHFEEVVSIAREVYGPRHRELAMALNNVGFLSSEVGRYDAAEAALHEALEIAEALPGAKGVVASILNNQGIVHKERGQQQLALDAYERSIELTRDLVGDDHPDVAGGNLNIGNVLVGLGRYAEAEQRFHSAYEGFERVPGDQRVHQVDALQGIAVCRWKLGEASVALEKLAAVRVMQLEVTDPGSPSLSSTLTTMGEIEAEAGRHAVAKQHFEDALALLVDKEVPPLRRTKPQLGLAKSLWATGDDHGRARELAIEAEAALAAAGDSPPGELAEVRGWLATHRL